MDYWEECISIALEECGLSATKEQINDIAGAVEGAHENYGMAFGYDAIPNPLQEENRKLQAEIKAERDKVICELCHGKGRIITPGPYHSSDSECPRCRGDGRHTYQHGPRPG